MMTSINDDGREKCALFWEISQNLASLLWSNGGIARSAVYEEICKLLWFQMLLCKSRATGLLIADLTYMNANVYHEIGLAMGQAIADGKAPGDNILLILDTSVPEEKQLVKFNLLSFRQIRFSQSEVLGKRLKREIMLHFGLRFLHE